LLLRYFALTKKNLLNTKDTSELLLLCKELPSTIDDVEILLNCAYEIPVSGKKLDEMRREIKKELKPK